jgi:cardiolipin synthase
MSFDRHESTRAALEGVAKAAFGPGNHVQVLRTGRAFFPAMLEALAAAQHSIRIEVYALWDGAIGNRLLDVLCERAGAGVDVRVIVDGIGSRALSAASFQRMADSGARCVAVHPVRVSLSPWRLSFRTHRKLVAVDGRVAFIGGFNFVDPFAGTDAEEPWLEYAVAIRGPAVHDAHAIFDRAWQLLGESHESAQRRDSVAGTSDMLLIDSGRGGGRTVAKMHEAILRTARHRIWIHNPFFLPNRRGMRLMKSAVRRGVDVRVILPGPRAAHRLLLHANRNRYDALLRIGVRLFEFQPTMLHAKTILVDDSLALIGSANFDRRSAWWNNELTAAVDDVRVAEELAACFTQDFALSEEVRPGRREGRVLGRLAGLLDPFL